MRKLKDNMVRFQGIVVECLPDNRYRIKLKNNEIILGYLCGNMIKNHIKLVRDDLVIAESSNIDLTKCRIIFRK